MDVVVVVLRVSLTAVAAGVGVPSSAIAVMAA